MNTKAATSMLEGIQVRVAWGLRIPGRGVSINPQENSISTPSGYSATTQLTFLQGGCHAPACMVWVHGFLWMMGFWSCDSTSDRSVSLLRSSPEQSSGPQHTVTLRLPAFFPAAEALRSICWKILPSRSLFIDKRTLRLEDPRRRPVRGGGVVGSDGRGGLSSDGRWEKDVWEGSPLPQAPRAKRFRRVGWGG